MIYALGSQMKSSAPKSKFSQNRHAWGSKLKGPFLIGSDAEFLIEGIMFSLEREIPTYLKAGTHEGVCFRNKLPRVY